jgi:hypothetical protein
VAAAALLVLAARYCVTHYVDFRVYWYASQSLLSGRQNLYDPTFVWAGPYDSLMDYRYPPLFLLMFIPLGILPYTTAGYFWFALKFVALIVIVRSIDRMVGNEIKSKALLWSVPFLVAAPYLIEDFHYGNVHLFVVCLTVFALYLFETERQAISASVLALSITIKVFPVFFLPYFLIRKKFRYVALTLLLVVLLNLLPAAYFGFRENAELLQTWYERVIRDRASHEFHGGINHSLKGVLQRYLSHIPYEKRQIDSNFPNINVANLSPESLQTIWYSVTGLILVLVAFLGFRHQETREARLLSYGLIACAIVAFAPSTGYNYFEILILPATVISAWLMRQHDKASARLILGLTLVAILLSFVAPLMPGKALQRNVQVHSPYFFSALALFGSCAVTLAAQRKRFPADGR